jgi:cytochrome P450
VTPTRGADLLTAPVSATAHRSAYWVATHGLRRVALAVRSRQGNPDAVLQSDRAALEDPFVAYAEMRRSAAPLVEGAYCRMALRHDVCAAVLRSGDFGAAVKDEIAPPPVVRFLRWLGPSPDIGPMDAPSPLAIDGPDHQRLRGLISRTFTPRAVEELRAHTAEVADELLARMEPDAAGVVDLVPRFARRLPLAVICSILGVPSEVHERVLRWGEGAAAGLESYLGLRHFLRAERELAELNAWMRAHLLAKRRAPGDDLLSRLCVAVDDEGQMTETELLAAALLVLGAGFETTVHLLAGGAHLLMRHPDQHARLAAEPALWPNAVDEILRLESPVQRTVRRALRPTAVAGVPVEQGEYLVLVLGAANRDPAVFADPDEVVLDRKGNRHFSFGIGVHRCVGSNVARTVFKSMLTAVLDRMPDFRCDPDGAVHYECIGVIQGMRKLPATFTPGPTIGAGLDETLDKLQRICDEQQLALPVTERKEAAVID